MSLCKYSKRCDNENVFTSHASQFNGKEAYKVNDRQCKVANKLFLLFFYNAILLFFTYEC